MDRLDIDRCAQTFFDAFCAGDEKGISDCLDAEFTAWHNHDNINQTRAEHLRTLAWLKRSIDQLRYEDVRRQFIPNGFVQEHVMMGMVRGEPIALRACIIGFINPVGRKLLETREYFDTAQLRPLMKTSF